MTTTTYDILIVDDSATTRAMIKRTIKMAQLPTNNVYEAPDGKAALDLLASKHVDLVLADLHMPVMTGVEMAAKMRESGALNTIPVVVVSAEPNTERLEQLKAGGVAAYIRKPFTPEDIRQVVTQVLEGAATKAA